MKYEVPCDRNGDPIVCGHFKCSVCGDAVYISANGYKEMESDGEWVKADDNRIFVVCDTCRGFILQDAVYGITPDTSKFRPYRIQTVEELESDSRNFDLEATQEAVIKMLREHNIPENVIEELRIKRGNEMGGIASLLDLIPLICSLGVVLRSMKGADSPRESERDDDNGRD